MAGKGFGSVVMPSFREIGLAVAALVVTGVSVVVVAVAVTAAVNTIGKQAPWVPRACTWVWRKLVGDPLSHRRQQQVLDVVGPLVDSLRDDIAAVGATVEHINGAVNNTPPGMPPLSVLVRQTHTLMLDHAVQLVELHGKVDDVGDQLVALGHRVTALESTESDGSPEEGSHDAG